MAIPYEVGIVFRGFVLVSHGFRDLPLQKDNTSTKELRGAFISAINSFIERAFINTSLEYLESGSVLFVFRISEVKSSDSNSKEPLILYGLLEKTKKKVEKVVKKFLEKAAPILELFIQKFNDVDFAELDTFTPFSDTIRKFFE